MTMAGRLAFRPRACAPPGGTNATHQRSSESAIRLHGLSVASSLPPSVRSFPSAPLRSVWSPLHRIDVMSVSSSSSTGVSGGSADSSCPTGALTCDTTSIYIATLDRTDFLKAFLMFGIPCVSREHSHSMLRCGRTVNAAPCRPHSFALHVLVQRLQCAQIVCAFIGGWAFNKAQYKIRLLPR
jgi:hypothetical protein